MDCSFDFETLLKNHAKKHKSKPTQFVSVAGGVEKRLQTNIKNRKSTRLTAFDNARNLEKCQNPELPPMSEAQLKMERRRQQLEKWKEEKEQKKKAQAALKKKPFLAGVPRNPLSFVPPPPIPKPSSSGRVTRSQTRNTLPKQKTKSTVKPTAKGRNSQSFAPKNAAFKAPEIKNLAKLPMLAPVSRSKNKTTLLITFDPAVPNTGKQTSCRPTLHRQNATEHKSKTRPNISETRSTTRGKTLVKKTFTSSSSGSDIEPSKTRNRIKTPGPRKPLKGPKQLNPKLLPMKSTSSEKSSEESGGTTSRRKSARSSVSGIKDSQSSSDSAISYTDPSSVEEQTSMFRINRNTRPAPNSFSPRIPSSLTSGSSTEISSEAEIVKDQLPIVVLSRSSILSTPKNMGVPKSESSSEEKLRSPKSLINMPLTPEQAESAKRSPCVTISRGKDNARKEMMWKIQEGLLDEDTSHMDRVDHFRKQLSSEIKRMTEMCDTWDKISAQTALPESVQEAVLLAVGQARLLMSQKLAQFASLVELCAKPEPGAALVTPADLHGFWDMVFIQVANVDVRFKKLEELRSRNWEEEEPSVPRAGRKRAPSKPVARRPPTHGTSNIRAAIAAARRAKKEQEQCASNDSSSSAVAPPEKTFEAGFFVVRSPVRSSSSHSSHQPSPAAAPGTPANRNTLLKAVLSSEAKKASVSKQATPFAMLRASIIGKNIESEGFALLPQTPEMTPVNNFATPGRSILKSTNVASVKSGKKSIKTVLFDDSEESDSQYQSCIQDSAQSIISGVKHTLTNVEANVGQNKENPGELKELNSNFVKTRRQRKSLQNLSNIEDNSMIEVGTPRRSSRQKKNIEDVADTEKTPLKQSGRKKSKDAEVEIVEDKRKRSTRKKALKNPEATPTEEPIPTPNRASRRNKAQLC